MAGVAQRDRDPAWIGLLWISPWILGFLAFMVYPIAASLWYSLTDYPLLEPPILVGLENYVHLLGDAVFGKVLLNTIIYVVVSVPIATLLSVVIAVALNQKLPGTTLFRAAVFVPSLIPVVATAVIWLWLYNGELGLVNRLLALLAIPGPDWLGRGDWAMTAIIIMSFWGIGPAVVIYLSALGDMPREPYEAAAIDGIGPTRCFWHITLPLISPVILFNFIVAIINAWQIFAVPYIMTGGGPNRATYFYSMYLYDTAFNYGRMGYASALAWVQLVLILAVTGVTLRASRSLIFYRVLMEVMHTSRIVRGTWLGMLLCVAIAFALPLVWMVLTSLKPEAQVMNPSGGLLPHPPSGIAGFAAENYTDVLTDDVVQFPVYLRNTLYVALLAVAGTVISSAIVAYGFARLRWRGQRVAFLVMLMTMMIPFPVVMVPLYMLFRELGWIGSFKPLWVPAWFGHAFSIFLLRQFYMTVPRELDDAARLDGCGHPGIFLHLMVPLARPALAVVALLQFLFVWNDFLAPLIFLTHRDQFTLALGLNLYQSQQGSTPWNLLMAASTLFVAPVLVLFLLTQRTFVQGAATQGLKF